MVYGEFIQESQLQLAKALHTYLPKKINCSYFVNSGTEAIEGAIKLAKGTPLMVSIERPKANENTAKKRRELIAGPKIVWTPTFKKRRTSLQKSVHNERKFEEYIELILFF